MKKDGNTHEHRTQTMKMKMGNENILCPSLFVPERSLGSPNLQLDFTALIYSPNLQLELTALIYSSNLQL